MTGSSGASSPEPSPAGRGILEHLEDERAVFVFPSEVSARFWLRRALDFGRRKALRSDRFLDWGDFKRRYLRYPGDRRAVNRAERTVFAWGVLEENRRRPFFRALVPPEHAGSPEVYLGFLVRSLPALSRLPALEHRWPRASTDKLEDLRRLSREYQGFLEGSCLYEPSFELPELDARERRFLVLFPEVIEDFQEYAPLLAGHPSVATVGVPPLPPAEQTLLAVHDTLGLELERLLDSVAALLDLGTDPEEIVISVAELAALEGSLSRRAELRAVPLVIHRSHPVTAFPTARVFRQIQAVDASRFSLDPLKDLLLNRAVRWREPALAAGLVRLGLDHRLLRSLPAGHRDGWEDAFRRAESIGNPRGLPLPQLRRFYRRLRRYLSEICGARSFHSLKERLTGFARVLLDTSQWQPGELGAFQFALEKLDELQAASAGDLPAFSLWLAYLDNELYLPRLVSGGVPVYDYPVAEGIAPLHHFLVNASQEGTSRRLKPLPALNPYEEESLELRERDLAPEHLRLFLHSGRKVRIGYSRQGLSRTHLPPALFVTHGSVTAPDKPAQAVEAAGDPELLERRAWAAAGSFPLVRLQQLGFGHALATSLAPKGLDATAEAFPDPELAARLLEPLCGPRGGEEPLRISPTALERFHACPFAYLLESCLETGEEDYTVSTSDPRELGAIMHRIFEGFFLALRPGGSTQADPGQAVRLEPSRRGEYRELLVETVDRVCRGWARSNPLPFAPLWLELQERARELALDFLDVELQEMAGEAVTDVELRLEAPFPGDPGHAAVLLVGKIDRVSRSDGRTTVVDYKKKELPPASQIFGPEASLFQMPFYLHLMQANGRPVDRAAYYSIENRSFRFVFGGGRGAAVPPELLSRTLEGLEQRIADMARRLRCGDYSIATGGSTACRYCHSAAACRRRYLLGSLR